MKFVIKGDEGSVVGDVLYRSHPNATDYHDANWLTIKLRINILGYKANLIGDILTFEIESFIQQLQQMNDGISKTASFSTLEELIEMHAQCDKLGHIDWNCKTMYPIGIGAQLIFSLTSDQSYIPKLILDLNTIIQEFPVLDNNNLKK